MKKLLYIFLLGTGILSCSPENKITENSELLGRWQWISTDGGLAYHIHQTPASTGKNYYLVLNQDHTYSLEEDDLVVSSGSYTLTFEESIYSGEKELYLTCSAELAISGVVFNGIIDSSEPSELRILDNNYDGIASIFKKLE